MVINFRKIKLGALRQFPDSDLIFNYEHHHIAEAKNSCEGSKFFFFIS
jgi:hypothetical protein